MSTDTQAALRRFLHDTMQEGTVNEQAIARIVLRMLDDAAPAPAGEPTQADCANACLSFRHDFGLLSKEQRVRLMYEAREWRRAWVEVLRVYDRAATEAAVAEARVVPEQPIDMILHCPACGMQHIDKPDGRRLFADEPIDEQSFAPAWTNPPHRSHLCHGCGHIWRPADVPTNGVDAIKTKGKADAPLGGCAAPTPPAEPVETVPWPTVTRYSGGASHEGIGGRVWIRLSDDGPEVEYAPTMAEQVAEALAVLDGCACRWDADDKRVQTCERHQGWLDVIAEWADRARATEAALSAAPSPTPPARVALSDEQIRNLWHKTFSTSNPFCPCDLGPFTKAVRAAEYAHGITPAQGGQP